MRRARPIEQIVRISARPRRPDKTITRSRQSVIDGSLSRPVRRRDFGIDPSVDFVSLLFKS